MIRRLLRRIRDFIVHPVLNNLSTQKCYVDVGTQILLTLKYKEFHHHNVPLLEFDEVGFRVYSGSNEDGILLYIFSLIGTVNKQVVDIGCAGIDGSNCANLIINHGWIGLLIDAEQEAVTWGREEYSRMPDVWRFPPISVQEFVTVDNINSILKRNGFEGEIDLLSIDIDGVDYWIWKAIDCISPRVVVVEVQDIIGPEQALTVPYEANFISDDWDYGGASLPAFVKLANEKGYRLVGCSRYGINAFFVRSDIGGEILPEVPIKSCFEHPRYVRESQKRWAKVKDRPWIAV